MGNELFYRGKIQINAPASVVWDGLINPELTKQYMFGCEVISDWKIGEPVIWRGAEDGVDYVVGHLVKYEPHQCLSFTVFDPNAKYKNIPENYLTTEYSLVPLGECTILEVSQGDYSKVEDGEKRYSDSQGWGMVLEALKTLVERK